MRVTQKQELVERTLELGDRAFRILFPMMPVELLKLDLTMSQLKVLMLLFANGAVRMSEIASAMDVSLATATGVVDRLVERDLVGRESQPDDRRVVLCRLSDKGDKLMSGIWELVRNGSREMLGTLNPEKLRRFNEAIEELMDDAVAIMNNSSNGSGSNS